MAHTLFNVHMMHMMQPVKDSFMHVNQQEKIAVFKKKHVLPHVSYFQWLTLLPVSYKCVSTNSDADFAEEEENWGNGFHLTSS